MSKEELGDLKIYADGECTQRISTIVWDNFVKMMLADGTEKIILNCARGGEKATATVWIRNEGQYDYGITRISFSDSRVRVVLSSAWIYPQRPIKITLVFSVPQKPTKNDTIKDGKINMEGYYIYKSIH